MKENTSKPAKRGRRVLIGLAGVLAGALASVSLAACAPAETTGSGAASSGAAVAGLTSDKMQDYCGQKHIKIAFLASSGSNSWHKMVRAQMEDEAGKCANVEFVYYDADGDAQKYSSLVNSAVAQGVNAIVTLDNFGSSVLTAYRNAYKAGVAVVPFTSDPGGTVGVDYTDFISLDRKAVVDTWTKWLDKALAGKGTVIEYGGPAGNTSSIAYVAALKGVLPNYPGIKLVAEDPVATNWDVADTQKAVAGVLSSRGKTDAIITDYTGTLGAVADAYKAAGLPLPAYVGTSSTNETVCLYQKLKADNPNFQVLSLDGTTNIVRLATRKAVAAAEGIASGEPSTFKLPVYIDTLAGNVPKCDPTLPPDADLSADLSVDQLHKLFK